MKELKILGIRVSAQTFDEALDRLLAAAARADRTRAHFATVHSLVEATSDRALAATFASASMVCTDGMPLVWVARRRGARGAERVSGPDVMLALCDRGRALGLKHFFVGGGVGTAERLAKRLETRYPGLGVAGVAAPPFRSLTADEDAALVDQINASGANVVWVGLGSPKQELWAVDHEYRVRAALLLPVGAAFDFYSGRVPRAPAWIRRLGLEWLFRLAMEPRRLWRRYLVTNPRFLWLLAREEFARRSRAS